MLPVEIFKHCPRCGVAVGHPNAGGRLQCHGCGFLFYFNPTVATACLVLNPAGQVLLVKRAKEPSKGKWALPGGFVDIGERAEDGIRRELREEVGLEVTDLQFLCSQANRYDYREVTYPVLDIYFLARSDGKSAHTQEEEVQEVEWVAPDTVNPSDLAFVSMQAAYKYFLETRGK
ncbi:MAG TPA: NUDIX domain-containing protein [Candidatus Limnocylindria bacterium]|jgi:mutator protein MutT|nr:NUDIX domain-containing protein [Candidatus Limnocylindria bacterium]